MRRRDVLRRLSTGTLAAGAGALWSSPRLHAFESAQPPQAPIKAAGSVRIRDVQTILTAPDGIRLVLVKVHTSEPGLYGVGCATFTQRAAVVHTAIEQYLKPFLIGRDVDEIEDIWQSSYVSSYWRNGPVLFNAMSGVDIALWDIKGKRAGMPVYQLLGGKCRLGAACYYHAEGRDFQEAEDNARKGMALGYRHIRVQASVPAWRLTDRRPLARAAIARRPSDQRRPGRSGTRRRMSAWCRSSSSTCVRARRRRGAAARRARARDVARGGEPVQGARAVSAVLCRGSAAARGERSFPDPAPAVERAARDGRAVQHGPRIRSAPQRAADRFHPDPHLADRRAQPRAQSAGTGGVLRRPHGVARPGRRVSRRARGAAGARAGELQLRGARGRSLPDRRRATCFRAAPRRRTAT